MAGKDNTNPEFAVPEMEQAVIGACLLEKKAISLVFNLLEPIMFSDQRHRLVWMAVCDMYKAGMPIDLLTVIQKLRAMKLLADIGGPYYLTELASKVASSANIEYHAEVIAQTYLSKQIAHLCNGATMAVRGGSHDSLKVLEDLKSALSGIEPKVGKSRMSTVGDIWIDGVKVIEANMGRFASGLSLAGAPTGFQELDNVTLGLEPGNMYMFAGSTSMGKTSLMLKMAVACAMAGHPVGIRSLEMTKMELTFRIAAYGAQVSTWRMKKGDLGTHDLMALQKAVNDKIASNIIVEDTGGTDSTEIYRWFGDFRQHSAQVSGKFPVFMMDFIQRAKAKGRGTREQEVSDISRMLKDVSMDFGGPMVALSQLSRAVDTRGGDHRPELSDLRDSGSLEQDSNFVAFLYRAEKYGITTYDNGESTAGRGEILVRKYREGGLVDIPMGFSGPFGWYDLKMGENTDDPVRYPVIKPNLDYSSPAHSEENEDYFNNGPSPF